MAAGCATVMTPGLCRQCSARYATEHFSHTCAIHIEGWWLSGCTGADPEIEEGREGGAYIQSGNWCATHSAQLSVHI